MNRYLVKHAFTLQSANARLMNIGEYYSTDAADQIEELTRFAKDGSIVLLNPAKVEKQEEKPKVAVNPSQDIAQLAGVGAKLLTKLTEAGFNTVDELKKAMLDKSQEETMKKLLGLSFEKVLANFQS